MHQRLVIVQNGRRVETVKTERLRHGADGNEQTLRFAAQMVREDSTHDERLRPVAAALIQNCPSPDAACAVGQLFEFVRAEIHYVPDPVDVERIADGWRTLETRSGDCGDKSILLASLLGCIGIKSQFIVQSWDGDLSDGYDHVHIEAFIPDGTSLELDPTNEHANAGWEASDQGRARFEIWPERSEVRAGMDTPHGLSGMFDDLVPQLISSGVQVGAQYGASALQQSRVSHQQGAQIGAQFENLAGEAKALFVGIDAKGPYLTADDYNAALAAFQTIESFVQQYPTEYVTTQWNSSAYSQAAQNYLTKFQHALTAQQSGGQLIASGGLAPSSTPSVLDSSSMSPWTIAAIVIAAVGFFALRKRN